MTQAVAWFTHLVILDALVALIGSLLAGVFALSALVINLLAALIESIIGIFVSGFSLGRVKPRDRREHSRRGLQVSRWSVVLFLVVLGAAFLLPKVLERKITLVAEDGHSLPFAALIIHKGGEELHERTDSAGNIVIPRFGTEAISLKDPRYVSKTWQHSEMTSPLVVERTVVGSALDSLADRFLAPAAD